MVSVKKKVGKRSTTKHPGEAAPPRARKVKPKSKGVQVPRVGETWHCTTKGWKGAQVVVQRVDGEHVSYQWRDDEVWGKCQLKSWREIFEPSSQTLIARIRDKYPKKGEDTERCACGRLRAAHSVEGSRCPGNFRKAKHPANEAAEWLAKLFEAGERYGKLVLSSAKNPPISQDEVSWNRYFQKLAIIRIEMENAAIEYARAKERC